MDSSSVPPPPAARPSAPTERPAAGPGDASGSPPTPPGLAGRRRGAARVPGARGTGPHGSGRIPVYPRVPTGPLRVSAAPPGRRSAGNGSTRRGALDGPVAPSGPHPLAGPPDADDGSAVTVALADPAAAIGGGATDGLRAADEGGGDAERLRARAETFAGDDEVLAAARARAGEHGIVPVGPGACAALTFLASATRARNVVEIGSGAGLGTVSLLRGMPHEGLLTSIDRERGHQNLARQACTEAGFAPGRVRMIAGRALEVLPRLSDSGYDLVLVDALTVEYPRYLDEAVRLLRPGGVVALDNVLWNGQVSDPVRREAISSALRETVRAVRSDERLAPLLLPVSSGLLCASLLS